MIKIFIQYSKIDKDAKLLLAGPLLNEAIVNSVKKEIAENNIADRVIFLGPRNDAARLYQAMDVFILPSLYEGLPIVGVEAQDSGLPCLFSDKISKQVGVNEYCKFISIDDESIPLWLDALKDIKNAKIDRKIGYEAIINNGFVMEKEIKHIEKVLVNILN